MRKTRSPRSAAAAALIAASLLLAACGGDGDDTDVATSPTSATDDGATETTGADAGSGTVTVEHAFGSTEVVGVPERIVSLDPQFTDALLAVGVAPAAFVSSDTYVEGGIFPWQEGLDIGLAEATKIPYDGVTYDNQDVFNAEPDLIVGSYSIEDQERFDALSSIAPTIGAVDPDRQVQRWQDLVVLAGQITGQDDVAAQVIADAEADLAERAEGLPGLDGKTYTFVNYVPGDALYVVADPEDGASEAFAALGLTINPEALAAADGVTGRAKLSLEQVDLLDSDMIIILANGGDPNDLIGWDALTAVQNDAVVEVDFVMATALNQPSSLSLPWALDELGDTLANAAG
ncbi:MAG: ABC transporter substrate-binding protein [Acidimicrobiales bacterium]|nr:ABC transporter substrate-binding protein [Acidimicrobiales bacterium]